MSDADAKVALTAYLKQRHSPLNTFQYWRSPALREAASLIERFRVDEASRAELLDAFGKDAWNDEAFAAVFRPYQDRYPFLAPGKQVALQKLQTGVQTVYLATSNASSVIGIRDEAQKARRAADAEIRQLLTTSEYEEYLLRNSERSQILARTQFNFSEDEFRKVYAALDSDGNDRTRLVSPPNSSHAVTLGGLIKALGEERYRDFQKASDPTFGLLSAIAAKEGTSESAVNAAYVAFAKAREQLDLDARAGPLPNRGRLEARRATLEVRDAALRDALGKDVAEIFLRSINATPNLAGIGPARGSP